MGALTPYEPQTAQDAFALAKTLIASRLLPKGINSPEAAFTIMAAGAELGLSPLTALRSIHMINGKIELSAELMLRLIIANGVKFKWVETSTERAEIRLERPGWEPHTHAFTMAEAKQAGLLRNPTWKSYPAAMLRARCVSSAVRAYCPDLLTGVYVEGEISEPAEPVAVEVVAETVSEPPKKWDDNTRAWFCANLGDIGATYDELAAWLEANGRPRPSHMARGKLEKVLQWLKDGGVEEVKVHTYNVEEEAKEAEDGA